MQPVGVALDFFIFFIYFFLQSRVSQWDRGIFAQCRLVAAFTGSLALFTHFAEVYLHRGLLH